MNLNIQVLSVSVTTKQGKKPYQNAEVAFKDLTSGKVSSKNITQYSAVFKTFSEAESGQVFSVTSEKNGDFWEWTAATRSVGAQTNEPQASAPAQSKYQASPKSTYETPEERAARQVLIVRQNALTNAVALMKGEGVSPASVEDVLGIAQHFADWVLSKPDLFKQPNDLPKADEFEDVPL